MGTNKNQQVQRRSKHKKSAETKMKNFLFHNIQSHLIFDKMLYGTVNKQAATVRKVMKSPYFAASTPKEFSRPVMQLEIASQNIITPAKTLERHETRIRPRPQPVKVVKPSKFISQSTVQERVSKQFEQAMEYRMKMAARAEMEDSIEQAEMYERMLPFVEDGVPMYNSMTKYE